jgi:hypothetical protein
MGVIGVSSHVGKTSDFTLTRDELIRMAHENIGALEEGAILSAHQLRLGIERLSVIVREIDASGKWQWTIAGAVHLPLASGVTLYDAQNGLPVNVAELVTVVHRDSTGVDSAPLTLLSAEGYETIADKLATGSPCAVHLTNDILLRDRKLYLSPTPATVVTQSVVLSTDGQAYRCIYPHKAAAVTRPTTGANWRMAWELGGLSPLPWVTGSAYVAGDHVRITYRRPIYDFDEASDIPDFPIQWPRLLVLRLQQELGKVYGIPLAEREENRAEIRGSYQDIFASNRPKTNNIHNKTEYF